MNAETRLAEINCRRWQMLNVPPYDSPRIRTIRNIRKFAAAIAATRCTAEQTAEAIRRFSVSVKP